MTAQQQQLKMPDHDQHNQPATSYNIVKHGEAVAARVYAVRPDQYDQIVI